jgi:hypothetical protein
MDNKSNVGENTDLALTGASALARLIGITFPLSSPPANAIAFIIDAIKNRRHKEQLKRLEKLVQSLDRRITWLEGNIPEEPDIDLFDEIVAKAVSDEDEDKTELYASLVQYWLEHKPIPPYEVRLLGNAIRELTVEEMKAFHEVIISQKLHPISKMPEQLQEVFNNRITYLGLIDDQFENVTQLGKKLVEIFKLSITTK